MEKALFFDLDGTLWNSVSSITKSWNRTRKRLNLPYVFTEKDITSHRGLTPEETAPIAFPGLEEKKALEVFRTCVRDEVKFLYKEPGILYPEEKEVLRKLNEKYPLYVVSNSDVGYIESYLDSYSFNHLFKGHLCAGDTNLPKWRNIQVLKEKENIKEVIYIGDTKKDRVESLHAGVCFIHAAYGFGNIDPDRNPIHSIKELPRKVEEVFSQNPIK